MGEKMINLTIDGVQLQVPEGTSVMSAAAGVGIEVPHLCFLKDINEISACKVCVVEVQGKSKLITACNSPVEEGMVVYTNSPKVRRVRKTNVELILSQHDCHCATCVRSRNCNLQQISNDLGILEVPFTEEVPETPWDHSFPLIRDSRKCIKCMRCVQICDKVQAMHVWDVQNIYLRESQGQELSLRERTIKDAWEDTTPLPDAVKRFFDLFAHDSIAHFNFDTSRLSDWRTVYFGESKFKPN